MTDLLVTEKQVAPVFPQKAEIYSFIASEALKAGDVVYLVASTGKVAKADANGSGGENDFLGVAMQTVGAGQVVSILTRGHVAGFDVSGLDYGATVYLSDTAGLLADSAGTTVLLAGCVLPLSDKDRTKILFIQGRAFSLKLASNSEALAMAAADVVLSPANIGYIFSQKFASDEEALAMSADDAMLSPANIAAIYAASPDFVFATEKGPVLKAPDGSAKRIKVANDGTVSSEAVV